MDCRRIEFCPIKSGERMERAANVLGRKLLNRILAFALYLLGAKRQAAADLTGMREESLKTAIAAIMRDGFPAFLDRRRSDVPQAPGVPAALAERVSARCEGGLCIVEVGAGLEPMRLPARSTQSRAVLLSMLDAGWLSIRETASALGISEAHCRELSVKLRMEGVESALIDKRKGQARDYRMGPREKAEVIQQFAARVIAGHSTSSETLAVAVNEACQVQLSARTIRWHVGKLGLSAIKPTLPKLLDTLKKTRDGSLRYPP